MPDTAARPGAAHSVRATVIGARFADSVTTRTPSHEHIYLAESPPGAGHTG